MFSGRQALGRSVFGLYTRPKGSGSDTGSDVAAKLPPVYAETMACFQGYEPDYLKSDTREWLGKLSRPAEGRKKSMNGRWQACIPPGCEMVFQELMD